MTARAHMQCRGIRIEIDDVGMIVERDGIAYSVVWVSATPAMPVAPAPAPPAPIPAAECTCLVGFPYPLPCPVHPRPR